MPWENVQKALKSGLRKLGIIKPYRRMQPVITDPWFPAKTTNVNRTLLIGVSPIFNQTVPNANLMVRQGMAHGWNEVAGPAKLVDVRKLESELDGHEDPAVYLTDFDFQFLTARAVRKLRNADTFVWVGIHPRTGRAYLKRDPNWRGKGSITSFATRRIILAAEPKFVWAPYHHEHLVEGWRDDGLRLEIIFDAADPTCYYPDPCPDRFGHIQMTYVGGYWAEKAIHFDSFLRRWEDMLVPFGYGAWPYKRYGGQLTQGEERQLYSTAGLVPLVSGPVEWLHGEPTGRYFKAAACGAFCIADQHPAVRRLFRADEMLQAESCDHFHDLVHDYLAGRIDTRFWQDRACRAVHDRHLYRHRALQIQQVLAQTRE